MAENCKATTADRKRIISGTGWERFGGGGVTIPRQGPSISWTQSGAFGYVKWHVWGCEAVRLIYLSEAVWYFIYRAMRQKVQTGAGKGTPGGSKWCIWGLAKVRPGVGKGTPRGGPRYTPGQERYIPGAGVTVSQNAC